MKDKKNIELRSYKVQHIVGKVPSTIERYGLGVISLAMIILLGVSFIVPYNRDITLSIFFTPQSAPSIGYALVDDNTRLVLNEEMRVLIDVYGTQEQGTIINIDTIKIEGKYSVSILLPNEQINNGISFPGHISIKDKSLFYKIFSKK